MCNFIIRPIKSYATVDVTALDGQAIKRGDFVEVSTVDSNGVVNGKHMGNDPVSFNMNAFIHTFTANPDDVTAVQAQESKWFKTKKESKK